jgi:hypothetical protein
MLHQALVIAGVCCSLTLPGIASAQADRGGTLEQRLEQSLQLIEKLAARVAELEKAAKASPTAAAAPSPASADSQAKAIAALQDTVTQISEGMNKRSGDFGLPLHGSADVGGAWSSGKDPVKLRGFNGGTLDIYLTPQFGDRVKGLVELAVEYGEDGTAAIDMERLQLGYTVNDALTVWAGRFHTPVGLWNTSFHHGANLQTSIFRPRFIDFEDKGGILPAHSVGVWASGKTALGAGKLSYDAYVTNGPRVVGSTLDFAAFTDNDSGKMLGFNLGYLPTGSLSGLTLGLHGFGSTTQTYDANGGAMNRTKLRMGGAYLGYDENDWEVIAEYYHFGNADAGSGAKRNSNAWFAQAGRTFGALTPFVRYEKAALDPNDNFFRSQESGRSYTRSSFGLRYAMDPKASVKFELSNTSESAATLIDENGGLSPFAARSYRRAALQYSIGF